MKVCFFAHLSSLLGAERMLLDLVTDLKKHYGVTCLVVLPNRGRLSDALTGLGTQCLFAEYGWWCHASELDFRTKTRIVSTSYELLNQKIVPALQIFDPDVIWTQTLVIPWGAIAAGHPFDPLTGAATRRPEYVAARQERAARRPRPRLRRRAHLGAALRRLVAAGAGGGQGRVRHALGCPS